MSDQPAQPEIRIFDAERLSMYVPAPGNEGRKSRLTFGMRGGNPRVTVFTNVPNDKIQNGVLSAPMDVGTFEIFLTMLDKIISASHKGDEVKELIECYGTKYVNDQPTKEKELKAELWFGRDSEGIIWICLVAPNRPKIRFNFGISDWHKIVRGDGNSITPAEASAIAAKATVNILRRVMGSMYTDIVRNPIPRAQFQSKFKKPGNSYGGGKPSFSDAPAPTPSKSAPEDDLPF